MQDDKAGEYTKAQLDQMSVEARLTNPVGFWPKTALAQVALASFLPGAGLGKFTAAAWDLQRPLETFCLCFRSGCFLRNPMVSCWVPLYVDRRLGRTRASTPAAAALSRQWAGGAASTAGVAARPVPVSSGTPAPARLAVCVLC